MEIATPVAEIRSFQTENANADLDTPKTPAEFAHCHVVQVSSLIKEDAPCALLTLSIKPKSTAATAQTANTRISMECASSWCSDPSIAQLDNTLIKLMDASPALAPAPLAPQLLSVRHAPQQDLSPTASESAHPGAETD